MQPNCIITTETGSLMYKAGDQFVRISVHNKNGIIELYVDHVEDPKNEVRSIVKEVLAELKKEEV